MSDDLRLYPEWDEQRFRDGVLAMGARLERLTTPGRIGVEDLKAELGTAYEELRVADEEIRAQTDHIESLLSGSRELVRQHERLASLVPVPVLATDQSGMVRSANPAAASLLGVSLSRVVGKPLVGFVVPEDRRALRELLNRPVEEYDGARESVSMLSRDGREVRVAVFVSALGGQAREVTWVLLPGPNGVGHDVAGRLPRALVELAELVSREPEREQVLRGAVGVLGSVLGPDAEVSVCLGDPLAPDLVATSSTGAQRLDGVQVAAGEGPCADAFRSGSVVTSPDLAADPRWPRVGRLLSGEQVAVVAAPIVSGSEVVGAAMAYGGGSLDPDGWREMVVLLAAATGAAIHEVRARDELRTLADQLGKALESRAVIDQAKGIIMADRHCGPQEAFQHLVDLSSARHLKLRVLAEEIVARVQGC